MNNPIKEQIKTIEGAKVPVLDVPMMSDERWQQLAKENAINDYILDNGHKPMSYEEAYRLQCERFANCCKECASV